MEVIIAYLDEIDVEVSPLAEVDFIAQDNPATWKLDALF